MAARVQFLAEKIADADERLITVVDEVAPALVPAKAVGPVTAAQLLATAGENTDRIKSKAAFAALCDRSSLNYSWMNRPLMQTFCTFLISVVPPIL
ncbi:hypothetical protein [Arthrobacter crystallopoietes]|uniref:hypothetical protein n=1 Tax=Crystallibacter crystallopoietes TaxID=37928 RepID=UPI001111030B|nr:hypothetical protein [Arthrobacter crystallopoietes]